MLKEYPSYDNMQEVFNKLSKHNQSIINEYLGYCKKDAGESTIKKYYNKIVQIADIINKPLDKLILKDIWEYLALLNISAKSTDTINDLKKTLKRFLKWKYKGVPEFADIDREIRQKKKGSSERLSSKDLITPEELELLIRGAETLKWKALLIFLFETASRPEEAFKLKWRDINFQTKRVMLNSSKTGEARTIPLDKSIIHLQRYQQEYPFPNVKDSDYIFPASKREQYIKQQVVGDFLKKLTLKVGIKKNIYPYLFRHTRLQELRNKLKPEYYEKIAGHSYQTGLEHYGHLDTKDAEEEMLDKVYNFKELNTEEKNEIKKFKKELLQMKELLKMYCNIKGTWKGGDFLKNEIQ